MTRTLRLLSLVSFLLPGGSALAADLSMPSSTAADPKAFWRTVMTGLYGPYDNRQKCWVGRIEGEAFCMRPHKLQTVDLGNRKEHHIAIGGRRVGGQDCHACAGAMGLAVLEDDGTTARLVASNSLGEESGSWGQVPPEENFVLQQLGEGNYGWVVESGYTAQGVTMAGKSIYGRDKDKIANIGDIRTYYDDCGMDPDKCRTVEFDLTFPPVPGKRHVDIEARLSAESDKVPAGDRFTIPFDEAAGKYIQPDAMSGALE